MFSKGWSVFFFSLTLGDTSFPVRSDYRFMKTESEATLDKKLENIPAKMIMNGNDIR